jgi:hypothetical protein
VNGSYGRASARIQGGQLTKGRKNGAMRRRKEQEDNAMMRKFAAALLASALLAGPAFAAPVTGDAGKSPAAAQTVKPAKSAKTHSVRKHRHYVVRHTKGHNRHGHSMVHVAKPLKTDKAGKSDKS